MTPQQRNSIRSRLGDLADEYDLRAPLGTASRNCLMQARVRAAAGDWVEAIAWLQRALFHLFREENGGVQTARIDAEMDRVMGEWRAEFGVAVDDPEFTRGP